MNTDDTDRNATVTPSGDDRVKPELSTVERAVAAYLDFLEGAGPRPAFDDLAEDDSADAIAVINTVLAGQGSDLDSSTPHFEELLVGTEFESALRGAHADAEPTDRRGTDRSDRRGTDRSGARLGADRHRARLERIATMLDGIDDRTVIRVEPDDVVGSAVRVSYLDLRAVFFPVDGDEPEISTGLRAEVQKLFDDADLAYVGVIADGSAELLTQLLTPSDLATVVVAPSVDLSVPWLPVLTAQQALRRMLEAAAPTWEPYRLDIDLQEPLDVAALASRESRLVLEAETRRAYRGDKKAAYQTLKGSAEAFTRLVEELSRAPEVDDEQVAAALNAIVREAA